MSERYLTEKERLQKAVKIRDRKIVLLEQRLEYAKQDVKRAELAKEAAGCVITALVEAAGGKCEVSSARLNEIAQNNITAYVKIDSDEDADNPKYVLVMRWDEDAEDSAENA